MVLTATRTARSERDRILAAHPARCVERLTARQRVDLRASVDGTGSSRTDSASDQSAPGGPSQDAGEERARPGGGVDPGGIDGDGGSHG